MKKILVTGGAGYIGSHVVVSLSEVGYEPIVVDNLDNSKREVIDKIGEIVGRKPVFYEADCRDEDVLRSIFRENEIHGVIHFAAHKSVGESVRNPLKYYDNNVGSLISLLKVMKEFSVDILVFSSSCTVYGIPDAIPVTEESEIKSASSPYGNTKQICESIIRDATNSGSLKRTIMLRYFNPIGAHESGLIGELPLGMPENLVPFLTQSVAGLSPRLTVFGNDYDTEDGTCIRDYLHVVDLAEAHVKSLGFMDGVEGLEIFNLGTGKGTSVLELIAAFEKVTGKRVRFGIGERRAGDIPEIYANPSKANEVLGWKTRLGIEEALRDAWNWQLKLQE